MKNVKFAVFAAALLASSAAYADRYQSVGEISAVQATATPEGNGHVDLAQAKPEGNGHVDIAQARPEGNGHVDMAQARPEGNGHVDIASYAAPEGLTTPEGVATA